MIRDFADVGTRLALFSRSSFSYEVLLSFCVHAAHNAAEMGCEFIMVFSCGASAVFIGLCCCSVAFVAPKLKKEARAAADSSRCKQWREREDGDGPGRVIEASVTVSVGGSDVDVGLLPCMEEFLRKETCAGLCAVEWGGIAFNLHFQMVVRIWATLLIAINKKVRRYLGWDTDKPAGGLILCHALKQRNMHTFRGMVEYCMKDRDEPHFQKVDHKISVDDQNDGIELHSLYGADALKNKVCLTPVNVFNRSLMYSRFKLNHPTGNRFLDVLERMVRSGHCYPSSHWIIPYQGQGMSWSKLNALWKCMTFPLSVTKRDIRVIFVAKDMQSNVQPRSDWFHARWQDNRPESMLAEGDSGTCDSTNEMDEDIPDFQLGDPYLPLVHASGVNTIAVSSFCMAPMDEGRGSVGIEATQEQDLPGNEGNCPLARLHDVLCEVELRVDNPPEQRPLRLKISSRFDEITSVLQNLTMDDLAL
ncbi:hypothetical protein L7F22_030360 [Adiantum nelumboides]|nr:hypothetical protein [Adiantum nelumboides]